MTKPLLLATFILCSAAISYHVIAQEGSSPQMILSIKVSEAVEQEAERRVLAEAAIATVSGQRFLYVSGGSHQTKVGEGNREVGTRLTGIFKRVSADSVQLALDFHIGSSVFQEHDRTTDVSRTERLEIRTSLRPGQTKRLDCSRGQWCELTIDSLK